MRLVWVFPLLFVPFSSALVVESTGQSGIIPVLYGSVAVFERDDFIHVYDVERKEFFELARGSNPSIFGYTVVFESEEGDDDLNFDGDVKDVVIRYADVRDKKVLSTKLVGHHPSIYAGVIAFSTKESELGIDYTNDGGDSDNIIRIYDLESKDVINTKEVGDFPAINQKYVVFSTNEAQFDVDLNADGDKKDDVIRVYERETQKVSSTSFTGIHPRISKDGVAVFASGGKVKVLDVRSEKLIVEFEGTNPSISNNLVMFARDGKLFSFDIESNKISKLDVLAEDVSVFEDLAVFVSNEGQLGDLNSDGDQNDAVIRYAKSEDADGDGFSDFVDNCLGVSNSEQNDTNKDGVGDECSAVKVEKKSEKAQEKVEPAENASQNVTNETVESKGIAWYWYLIVIVILPFAIYHVYKYYKKKQKSFGF